MLAKAASIRVDEQDEEGKQRLREEDQALRSELAEEIVEGETHDQYRRLAEGSPLDRAGGTLRVDPRIIHGDEGLEGFDVTIANPPYQMFSGCWMEGGEEEKGLEQRGYRTAGARNLYAVLTEASWAVTKEGGTMTVIVPLSVSYEHEKGCVREMLMEHSSEISTRHHDNRPDTTFKGSPTTTSENRQRVTIITARKGGRGRPPRMETGGLLGWPKAGRADALRARDGYRPARAEWLGQWPRFDTETAERIAEALMTGNPTEWVLPAGKRMANGAVEFPNGAYKFMTVTLPGQLGRTTPKVQWCRSEEEARMTLTLMNSSLGLRWWKWFGNGHVVRFTAFRGKEEGMGFPEGWRRAGKQRRRAVALGERLEAAVARAAEQGGVSQRTEEETRQGANLWKREPELMREVDEAVFEGLKVEHWKDYLETCRVTA